MRRSFDPFPFGFLHGALLSRLHRIESALNRS